MAETVSVGGYAITQELLESIFDAMRAHHWLGIPPLYRPSIGRFCPVKGPEATLDQVTYSLIADGTITRLGWFRDLFKTEKPRLF